MNKEIKLYEIFYSQLDDPTWTDLVTYYAYKLNDTKLFKGKLSKLIYKLESKKYKDKSGKIVDMVPVELSVPTFNNVQNHAYMLFRTKAYEVWHLELSNGYTLDAADEHLVYCIVKGTLGWKYVDQLQIGDYVLTDGGWETVKKIYNTKQMQHMADVTIAEDDHSYFANGILNHNTTTTASFITWYVCFHNDRNVFVCANKGRTATEIMGKIKEVMEGLPYFMKPGIINLSESRIKLENGCSIKCAAASQTPATGDSIQLLYIDEAALIKPNIIEEYWGSVIPTLSNFPNAQTIVSSTPRGRGNRFFKIVDGAIKHENDFYYQRVDWWEVPEHDEKWAEKQRAKLGDELFEREFALSFDTGSARLISNQTVRFFDRIKTKFVEREFYNVPLDISKKILWAPDFDPAKMTYQDLKNRRFLLVVDTAQGIEAGTTDKKDSDYNVINIFEIELMSPNKINKNRDNKPISVKDVVQYKQVGIYLDNYSDEAACAEAAKFITFQMLRCGYQDIDNVRVLVEINFNGNNWITKFKNHPTFYDNIILKTVRGVQQPGKPVSKMKLQYGFRTTGGEHGKTYYCELGSSMMRRRQIIVRQYDERDINVSSIGQLNQFCKNAKGSYEGQCCHDDISVTCMFVSIAQESAHFIIWLNEWLETMPQTYKVQVIRQMLEIYVEQEAQMSDELFNAFYKAASANFGKVTHKQNGYGNLMRGGDQMTGYGLNNGYNQGFGNIMITKRY